MSVVNKTGGITLLGLGSGQPEKLTREAWDWLMEAPVVAVRSNTHAIITQLPVQVERIELIKTQAASSNQTEQLADLAGQLLQLANQPGGVTYATPGNPLEDDAVAVLVLDRAREAQLSVRVIAGVGLAQAALESLGQTSRNLSVTVDALELASLHTPSFPPTARVVVTQVESQEIAAAIKAVLLEIYPPDFPARILFGQEGAQTYPLGEIDQAVGYSPYTRLALQPLGEGTSLEAFQEIIAHLRAPDGCPWDRQQTHLTLRKHLLEESYEAIDAMDRQDMAGMIEEFGDLLLQIVLNAQIASETGEFHMADIIHGIYAKIVRRHPHVFGDVSVDGVKGVLVNWEKLKATERENNGDANHKKGLLDGVPISFPALAQAHEIQERATRVGFDWPDVQGVFDKILEEIEEVRSAPNAPARESEFGDLFFALV
ncbi:MAG: nucleoside triphosphate pyrophosphohydrolase, partial [Anaerolineaceae bacterium]|nr:nucleoside triphosphate pyrophosphohydrolase [Anaerolineaceae bacterium]